MNWYIQYYLEVLPQHNQNNSFLANCVPRCQKQWSWKWLLFQLVEQFYRYKHDCEEKQMDGTEFLESRDHLWVHLHMLCDKSKLLIEGHQRHFPGMTYQIQYIFGKWFILTLHHSVEDLSEVNDFNPSKRHHHS